MGKNHNYPSKRKPYSTRKNISGRKKKVAINSTISFAPTYFDKQLKSKDSKVWLLLT